ncbi:MAG: hypothetical protein QF619_06980 [Candidatus Binatia bacterium]|jgi:hypothetical protein|nr:hypothetical protein [Candidatus Binatia bacterium]
MLFLTEQDVMVAVGGPRAFKEAVEAIEEVFRQQATPITSRG